VVEGLRAAARSSQALVEAVGAPVAAAQQGRAARKYRLRWPAFRRRLLQRSTRKLRPKGPVTRLDLLPLGLVAGWVAEGYGPSLRRCRLPQPQLRYRTLQNLDPRFLLLLFARHCGPSHVGPSTIGRMYASCAGCAVLTSTTEVCSVSQHTLLSGLIFRPRSNTDEQEAFT
jgi:hypothetical protein